MLVGNKCDRIKNIDAETINWQWVYNKKCKEYIEASALKLDNVDYIF